jgi:Protein of unknown function (DUF4013)
MQYFGAYRFLFESPKWATHLLIGTVCQLVPIVGPMVWMGYGYDVIEAKHRYGRDLFPVFDFNRLGSYLARGAWAFLVALVVAIPVFSVIGLLFLSFAISLIAAENAGEPNPFSIVLFGVVFTVFAVLFFASQFVTVPMILRAGLSQDFAAGFSMTFIRDFLARVWKEQLLSFLVLIITWPFLFVAGLLLLFVGVYAAAALMLFAQIHFQYQLYELYLERGGTPIPLKDTP